MHYMISTYNKKNKKSNKTNEKTRTKQAIIKCIISLQLQGSRAVLVFKYHTDHQQQLF